MYAKSASEAELAAFGFKPSDFNEEVLIWPENFEVVKLFTKLSTQWRVAAGGATGLDYSAVYALFKMHRIKKKRYKSLLADIAVMESAALDEMYKDVKHG
ncbi:DUF1799 domain-containing protein [Snodgrassella alvi]|uniref:DUF1799 domain-containing protein n=1 Tax=Snodgrassella alvi TaxID=1196083 RepID=UPI000CC63B12|nr:DUF1799 domain-containing protein [Snodgrassella alvi]PIT43408.1 hypothetical protein BHC51_11285 [Snodgrassella alvi]PIT51887.1 hypothetical protein BHC44_09770 [Snodgrassella alvi]